MSDKILFYPAKTLKTFKYILTLKAPITNAADNFDFFLFSEKISLVISWESLTKQTIHVKCQDLFALEKKEEN